MKFPASFAKDRLPWYDGWWLERYIRAKRYIGRHAPTRLPEFLCALAPLRTRPDFRTARLHNALSSAQTDQVLSAVQSLRREQLELHELRSHGRFVVHDHPMLAALHAEMADRVGDLAGEPVEPSYSFLGLYKQHGRCDLHLDAPVSKWTLDYCVDQSVPWPIWFSAVQPWPEDIESFAEEGWEERLKGTSGARFTRLALEPGQAVLFSGSSQWHYREPFPGASASDHWTLLFLHYLPKGMKDLAAWEHWETTFDVPGLSAVLQ